MKATVQTGVHGVGGPATVSRSPSPHRSSAGGSAGRLAQLSAFVNRSSRVQEQVGLAHRLQNSEQVQAQLAVAAAINQAPASQPQRPEGERGARFEDAAAPNRTLQLYGSLKKKDYALQGESEDSHFFTTQSKEPELTEPEEGEFSIGHTIARSNAKQNLKLADDGTMAINDTAAEAKEFYATDPVLASAKAKLEDAGSMVKLDKGSGLSMATGGKVLHKITPAPAQDEEEDHAEEFASLVSHICIEMASGVMGNQNPYSHEAVFQRPGEEGQSVVNIRSSPDAGDTKIGRLAGSLARSKKGATREQLREEIHQEDSDTPLPGRDYGKKSGRGQLNKRERTLGVNRYAQPEVGEGYATFSVRGHDTRNIDYATGGDEIERLGHVWGYHFAGVVAKSRDGKDSVTLENYNRTDDVFVLLRQLLQRLVDENRERIGDEVEELTSSDDEPVQMTQKKLQRALEIARTISDEQAQSEFLRIVGTYTAGRSWFFQMYGSCEGQSFHEQQAASGGFVNPLTLRVRPQDQAREALRSTLRARLQGYPAPAGDPEFAGFNALRDSCVETLNDAETEQLIRTEFSKGLSKLAAYLVEGAASVAVRLALARGAAVAVNAAQPVAAAQSIKNKARKSRSVCRDCRKALQDRLGSFWLYEIENKRLVRQALTDVDAVVAYLLLVTTHYHQARQGL